MVYLDVYDSIFYYLEDIGIVDDVIEYSEDVLNPLLDRLERNETRNDLIIEFALFNYIHEKQMLIDFILDNLYSSLNEIEKKELNSIKKSRRYDLKFRKKIKQNKIDTKGRELYDFYFEDLNSGKIKIIVSSTNLDELKGNINARLIDHPMQEGKYTIIGGIFDRKTFDNISDLSSVKFLQKGFEKIRSTVKYLLNFSKEHGLEEIDKYENKKSDFIRQDRKIMRINRLFFEKFEMGFDDFLKDFFELSNNNKRFIEIAEYYLSVVEELKNAVYKTNYIFSQNLLFETDLIKGFIALMKKDSRLLKQSIVGLQKRGKTEFENMIKNEIALSRENIIKNQKRFLKEKIAPLKLEGYDSFIKKIDSYSPEQIKEFLTDVVNYLEQLSEDFGPDVIFNFSMIGGLLDNVEEIPYLNEAIKKQKTCRYIPEEFYSYIDVDDDVYDVYIFLSAVYLVDMQKPEKAYKLLKENKIKKINSFYVMFLIGKIFSFFDDKNYKKYFNQAKRIDRKRYKNELKFFLDEKGLVL